uniref:Uncharacterized protein n=1 Tax=Arundo donax TaxID=35708 RepID=A0A0A9BTN9_ARUDO
MLLNCLMLGPVWQDSSSGFSESKTALGAGEAEKSDFTGSNSSQNSSWEPMKPKKVASPAPRSHFGPREAGAEALPDRALVISTSLH